MTESSQACDEPQPKPGLLDYLSGLALGLLVGGIVGLSVSQLAGEFLAGLIALLAAFFGLGGKLPLQSSVPNVRLLAFCIGFVIGLPSGIVTRTHAWLAPSFKQTVESYTLSSGDQARAIELAIFEKTGLRTGSLSSTPEPEDIRPETRGIAFSAATSAQCNALLESAHASPQLRLQAMAKFQDPWQRAGSFGLSLSDSDQTKFADYIYDVFCEDVS
ncbi:hypothetical protein [Roseobacter litoralis]|uniref:hypothetical protein n=1 Tax=Roseobacter litoralis TaxID=42443 RepID=UPI0024945790|nr:hypothetical protein [Roseobacter litoralis]